MVQLSTTIFQQTNRLNTAYRYNVVSTGNTDINCGRTFYESLVGGGLRLKAHFNP